MDPTEADPTATQSLTIPGALVFALNGIGKGTTAALIYETQSDWARQGDPAAVAESLKRIGLQAGLDQGALDACLQDAGTVYFNESAEEARKLVKDTLSRWDTLLGSLPQEDKERLVRSMGLKMEQLKAELAELDHLHDDHD